MQQLCKHISGYSLLLLFIITFCFGFTVCSNAQVQTNISDYIVFGGTSGVLPGHTPPSAPGYGVQLGSSSNLQGGSVGSFQLVKSTGNLTINANIYSGGKVDLANSNTISGKITAANAYAGSGNILSAGSNINIGNNVDVNGNILISGGVVTGRVTHPVGTTYTGPFPGGGNVTGTPVLPVLPQMPAVTNFPAAGAAGVTTTQSISPGAYANVNLSGNKTLTLSGTGVYVFNAIKNSGTTNNFVFDFKNDNTGSIKIYVYGDVDLNKVKASIINGGSASKIYLETHGNGATSANGSTAWNIANGSSGNGSKWLGSVWAPYAAINVGSGTGATDITGALWSATQVNIQSGVLVYFAPFIFSTPPNVNAGPDKPLDFINQTTLNGTSSTNGAAFSWQALNGGVITSNVNAASITVSAAGTYVLTVTANNSAATDTATVTGKVNTIIGSELQSVIDNFNPANPPSPFFIIQHDSIVIDVITKEGKYADVLALLTTPAYGLTNVVSNGASNFIITGLFPINKLSLLNALSSLIVYCRPYYQGVNNSGIINSAGDSSVNAFLVRKGYSLNGEGIKIGVISDSYNTITAATTNPVTNTAAQDVTNGDLPGVGNPDGDNLPVQVIKDYPFRRSDEGRAMLQIIHDVAPKSELFFRTGFISAGDFAVGIDELKQAGCKIIVDDVTFITEPFLKDGVVANAVNNVVAGGTTYFSAAGNFASKSYENVYSPVAAPTGLTGTAHNFGGGDRFQSVNLSPGNYTIVLQWADDIYSLGQTALGGTKNDLDIYLTPNTDGSALFGFNRNNINGDPIEVIPFTVTTATTTNILVVNNTTGTNPVRFKYIVFRGDITFNEFATGTSTLIGQANAIGAIAVGAARYDKAPPYPGPLSIESFSSTGGTFVNNIQRNKPELVGPDGVNTTVNMGVDYDNNSYSNFFGTSAAAPHAAAVAALLMQGKNKFSNQSVTSPQEIRTILQTTATDMNTPGFDFTSGYGFINADAAMRTFAKPEPALIQLVVPAGITPGPLPFTLTVTGLNFSPGSVIMFRDSALGTTIINSNTASAAVPAFIGDPVISVYTPPLSSSGLDGGTSDSLKFFGVIKKNITVTADNKTKKYAQQLPALTASVAVDGVPLQNTTLTLQAVGLENINFATLASATSNVGTYIITPSRIFNPANPADVGLLELYNYSFSQGSFTIEKLPVTITANDATVTYGKKIPDVQFDYHFDGTGIPDSVAFLNSITAAHQNRLAKDISGRDILGLVNGQAVTIVNRQAIPIVNGQAVTIVNGQAVTIVNGQAIPIVNSQAITIVNGQAIPIVNNLTAPQISGISFSVSTQSLQNFRKIYNQELINGVYVTDSTNVVDITQESILDYNINSAQTYMLSSLSQISPKGLIDIESFANGQAITIVNSQAVTIVNGQAVTIVNGQAVTIVNGQAVTIVNGQAIPIVNNQNKTAVIIDSSEIGQLQNQLKSLNTITGLSVGNQFLIPGSLVNDNLLLTHLAGVITILPATVVITPTAGQSKVFGTNDPVFTYTNNANLQAVGFTGAIGRAPGDNVGAYTYTLGNLSAGTNYNLVLSSNAPVSTFTITPKVVTIIPNAGQSKIYGDADPVFTFTNNGSLTNFTGALNRVAGNNVGNYAYALNNLSAGINYTLTLDATNKFAITAAALNVKADLKVIFKGDPLPAFTSMITGLKNGDNPGVNYTLTPVYSGEAGVYTIVPLLQPFANILNYTTTYTNGQLYVNPKGNGAKKLRPALDCVVEIVNPAPGQFRYIARFVCINDNATPVYVPIGIDNLLSSNGGSFNGSAQPVLFNPGQTNFEVPFDGINLSWVVRTYESNHKTATASNASSGSGRCSNITVPVITLANPVTSAEVGTAAAAPKATEQKIITGAIEKNAVKIYPNPVKNKATIYFTNQIVNSKELVLVDALGRTCPLNIIGHITKQTAVIDLSGLAMGIYFIKFKTADGYRTILLVKE